MCKGRTKKKGSPSQKRINGLWLLEGKDSRRFLDSAPMLLSTGKEAVSPVSFSAVAGTELAFGKCSPQKAVGQRNRKCYQKHDSTGEIGRWEKRIPKPTYFLKSDAV